jgi:hypothetical protein
VENGVIKIAPPDSPNEGIALAEELPRRSRFVALLIERFSIERFADRLNSLAFFKRAARAARARRIPN